MYAPLQEFLGARGARYERVDHPEAFTSQEAAAAAGTSGWEWAKVVLVKEREGLAIAVLPACCRMDLARLKGLIGRGEIQLASVEEILTAAPGCELGTVPPFGELFGMPTFVDESLLSQREITMPAGDHRSAIRMRVDEFQRLAQPRTGRFAEHESGGVPVPPRPRITPSKARARATRPRA